MPDIITPPSDGDATVRAMVADVVNATWTQGLLQKTEFSTKIATAQGAYLDAGMAPDVTAGSVAIPSVTAPGVVIPASAEVGDIFDSFTTEYLEVANWLTDQVTDFITTHFPNEATLYAAAEGKLSAALASGSYIPADVQAQIFGDDEARIVDAKLRAQDAVVAQFATRGFPLPPDVAASAVLQIEQKAQDELAESSRKIAILSVEQFKFVIEKVLVLRAQVIGDMVKYIAALASAPEMASRLVNIGYDAQSKLISSAADFYRADVAAKDMVSKVEQYNNSTALEAAIKNQAAEMALISEKVKALLSEAGALAQMATSLFNNVNAGVSITASRGASVGYNYSNDTAAAAPAITDVG